MSIRTGNICVAVLIEDKTTTTTTTTGKGKGKGKTTTPPILIAVPHFHWNPVLTHVKIMQAARLVMYLTREGNRHKTTHIIIGGDFNSLPRSAVIEFLTHGCVQRTNEDLMKFCPKFNISHELQLSSAYDSFGNPPTNFTSDFTGCIDYILFTQRTLAVSHVLQPHSPFTSDGNHPLFLPDDKNPSDHVPIAACFVRF